MFTKTSVQLLYRSIRIFGGVVSTLIAVVSSEPINEPQREFDSIKDLFYVLLLQKGSWRVQQSSCDHRIFLRRAI